MSFVLKCGVLGEAISSLWTSSESSGDCPC